MFPNDYLNATASAKTAIQFLQEHHTKPCLVHMQLWFNDCYGVNCVHKGGLNDTIPNEKWIRVPCQGDSEIKGWMAHSNLASWDGGQFQGTINILNKEVEGVLSRDSSYQVVYFFFFTDGGSSYPQTEMNTFCSKLSTPTWKDSSGGCKLRVLITTNKPQIDSLTMMQKKFNDVSTSIFKKDVCTLKTNVPTSELGTTMIE